MCLTTATYFLLPDLDKTKLALQCGCTHCSFISTAWKRPFYFPDPPITTLETGPPYAPTIDFSTMKRKLKEQWIRYVK